MSTLRSSGSYHSHHRSTPSLSNSERINERIQSAYEVRKAAAALARSRPHPRHKSNGDETRFRYPKGSSYAGRPTYLASFTKGLPHDVKTGLICSPSHFTRFVRAIEKPTEDHIKRVPLGPRKGREFLSTIARNPPAAVRAWESMGAGSTYELIGYDAQAVTMPPPPDLRSPEFAAEISELYWMALLRDVPTSQFSNIGRESWNRRMRRSNTKESRQRYASTLNIIGQAIEDLSSTAWASKTLYDLSQPERKRRRGKVSVQTVFRGITPGDDVGPYLSQFLLVGTVGLGEGNHQSDGFIQYGAMRMDQRVRVAEPGRDYMTTWRAFIDVQNGADVRKREKYNQGGKGNLFRFITTPRDLATYVHYDALYQAYLNACIILLDIGAPFDKGLPFQDEDRIDKQQGFATFGGPHILTLVTEVATRALKAVRFQKYNVHRRLRPEAACGLIDRFHQDKKNPVFHPVIPLYDSLSSDLLQKIGYKNDFLNATLEDNGVPRSEDLQGKRKKSTLLLPMAYAEGSPMHPSYGAGHAVVAGACVTILKGFFDHKYELPFAYVPSDDGMQLNEVQHLDDKLTVEWELNKLCSNISIGRNWAGVHYFSDYYESILLGEKIALGILEEQKLTYHEKFSMTVPLFDGFEIEI